MHSDRRADKPSANLILVQTSPPRSTASPRVLRGFIFLADSNFIPSRRVHPPVASGEETGLAVADEDERQHVEALGSERGKGSQGQTFAEAAEGAGRGGRGGGAARRQQDGAGRE